MTTPRRILAAALVLAELASVSQAADFVVTTTDDAGPGSLRQAVLDANAAPGPDLITFDAALVLQAVTLTTGELVITDDLEVRGLGAPRLSISGNDASRIFDIRAGVVALKGMTIRNGRASDGGAIANRGDLKILGCIVRDSVAQGAGGALYNHAGAVLFSQSTTILHNTVTGVGGDEGGSARGGALFNAGTVTLANATLCENRAVGGDGAASGGEALGGAIHSDAGSVTLRGVTVCHNDAVGGTDGGGSQAPGTGGAISSPVADSISIESSIVAENRANRGPDVAADVVSTGSNLVSDATGSAGFDSESDQAGSAALPIDPQLGPLQVNGCTTPTHFPQPGSPVVDAGSNSKDAPWDQRGDGFERVLNGRADIGAIEKHPDPPLSDLKVRLNFKKEGRDRARFNFRVPMPRFFVIEGETIRVDVGGAETEFVLNRKGKGRNALGRVRLTQKKGSPYGHLKIRLKKGSFAGALTDEGLGDEDVEKTVRVTVNVTLQQSVFGWVTDLTYTGKAGMRGKAR